MKVYVKGQGEVTISKADHVASGGEGSVYAKGSTAIKLYTDPSKMIPTGKIAELSAIADPDVIKPERVVVDRRGTPIGYTMRFLRNTHALCELFPPAFRNRNSITPQTVADLVLALRARVENVHKAGILVVDLNEMNYLVDDRFREVYAIDVDSYQTPHFPATAIMPSVRDPLVTGLDFTEVSDWFSFACVAFNLFTGIHPYKGKHPSIKGLEDRMRAGVSVFNSDVKVPRVVLPFDVIPDVYRQWFKAVLEDGKRVAPPFDFQGAVLIIPTVRTIRGTDQLDIAEWYGFSDRVLGIWDDDGMTLVWTEDGLYLGNRRLHDKVEGIAGVGFTPKMRRPVVAGTSKGLLKLLDASTGTEIPTQLRADQVSSHGGRIYVRVRDALLEVRLTEYDGRILAGTEKVGSCLEHASRLYPGVLIQWPPGDPRVTLLSGYRVAYQVKVPELSGYRVVDAKFDNVDAKIGAYYGVLMVVGEKGGKYDRLVFRFHPKFEGYDLRVVDDVNPTGLNFVVLDTGICVCINEDDKIELFNRNKPGDVKVIDDPAVGGDMHLFRREGGRVVFPRGNSVCTLRMK